MMNQLVLVGRLVTEGGKTGKVDGLEVTQVKIAVPRSYKNDSGEYETDILPVMLTGNIADKTLEYCKKGDIVGIKGRVQQDQESKHSYILAEKITFLSSSKNVGDEDEE